MALLHPDVENCAVIGVPDAKTGEAVKLFVVTQNAQLSVDDLKAFCRENLTGYKIPRHIEFRDELPMTPVGKILRKKKPSARRKPLNRPSVY